MTTYLKHIKKSSLLAFFVFSLYSISYGQVYNPINYNYNGTPTYGIKIKTNLPFTNGSQMPTLIIEGLNYGQHRTSGLLLTWYIYDSRFWYPKISSFGGDNPKVMLSNEGGKVIIFIDERNYYQRFTIRTFAQGMGEQNDWFANWQTVDEPLSGLNTVEVPYENSFKGMINFPNGIWNTSGSVGIGTTNPDQKLTVKGKIHAEEVIIDLAVPADYVFKPNYKLMPLNQVEQFVRTNSHLPEIPSATEITKNGLNMGEMQNKLLQKVEELTLYLIDKNKEIQSLQYQLKNLNDRMNTLSSNK
jgi:hypothetical protein